jgi:hypothetical protein
MVDRGGSLLPIGNTRMQMVLKSTETDDICGQNPDKFCRFPVALGNDLLRQKGSFAIFGAIRETPF